tara:strand:+ start:820 stop:2784 length:1965 start_codon:yes stop_codon:yes gene_type:complete
MAYSDNNQVPSNINYTSKDFSTIKADLIQYTKAYFPDTYKDFNETSPGMMLIELASYVGDVLSYYIDYNYKESILTTASERKNVIRLAEFLGYKTTPTTAALARIQVTTEIGAVDGKPDYSSLGVLSTPINEGLQIASSQNSELIFETIGEIDFTISGSPDIPRPTSRDSAGITTGYQLTRFVNAVSGQTKTKSFTITSPQKFLELDLGITNVVDIISVKDSSGVEYFEVDYLAQDRILKETHYVNDSNRVNEDGSNSAYNQGLVGGEISVDVSVPYVLEYIKTNKKFVRKVDPETNNTVLQFGNGLYKFNISGSSSAGLFSTIEQQGMNVSGVPSTMINAALNNLTTNNSLNLGETPANTILTVTYREGGGANSNVQVGELTNILNAPAGSSISATNITEGSGGSSGETIIEIKENAKTFFASQLRCVTREDYVARILNLPAKFGNIAKAYVVRLNDISGLKLYTLSYNQRRQLVQTPPLVLNNLRMYLEQFRMINDALDFGFELPGGQFSGYNINFGVYFEINADRRFNKSDVKLEVINCIRNYFRVDKMQFAQAINLGELKYEILGKDGVIGCNQLKLFQSTGEIEGFSSQSPTNRDLFTYNNEGNVSGTLGYGWSYAFENALQNDIVRPSATPSVFELRNPNTDIYGRVI